MPLQVLGGQQFQGLIDWLKRSPCISSDIEDRRWCEKSRFSRRLQYVFFGIGIEQKNRSLFKMVPFQQVQFIEEPGADSLRIARSIRPLSRARLRKLSIKPLDKSFNFAVGTGVPSQCRPVCGEETGLTPRL